MRCGDESTYAEICETERYGHDLFISALQMPIGADNN